MKTNKNKGFTLVELAVVLSCAALLAAVAAPSFTGSMERGRLKSAAEEHVSAMYLAKGEALRAGKDVFYSFKTGIDASCYGFRLGATCDCAQTDVAAVDMCTLSRVDLKTLNGVTASSSFTADGTERLETVRGTATAPGQLTWSSRSGYILKTGLTSVGRVYSCTPAGLGAVPGYTTIGC